MKDKRKVESASGEPLAKGLAMDDISRKREKCRLKVPFRLMCQGCKSTFAKGVEVDAMKECVEKYHPTRKVGKYNFECPCCGCKIVMKRNSGDWEYEVIKGAGKRLDKKEKSKGGFD